LKNLKIAQINARSIRPRRAELSKLVVEKSVDVLVVVESWLKPNSAEELPKIAGMTPAVWKHRDITYKNGHGGGVIIYVNSSRISFMKVDLVNQPRPGVDMCSIKIFPTGDKSPANSWGSIVICGVYVPPDLAGSEWFKCVPTDDCIVCADVNCCGSWSSFGTPTSCGDEIDTWMVSRNMIAANEPLMPTRICPSSGSFTSPDLTAIPGTLAPSTVWLTGDDIGSDHLPIILSIQEMQVPVKRETKWAFKKARWDTFTSVLDDELCDMTKSEDINTAVDNLTKAIFSALNASVPRGCRSKAYFWWCDEVEVAVSARRKALKVMQQDNSALHRQQYHMACEEANRVIAECKREAWREYCNKLNHSTSSKEIWRTVASLDGKRGPSKTAESLIINGKAYSTEQEKATAFNNHQTRSQHRVEQKITDDERRESRRQSRSTLLKAKHQARQLNAQLSTNVPSLQGKKIDVKILQDNGAKKWYRGVVLHHMFQEGVNGVVLVKWANGDADEQIDLAKEEWMPVEDDDDDRLQFESDFSEAEVKWVINSMAYTKAGGPDGVPMQVLQHLTSNAISELTRIANMSWRHGVCPTAWKSSRLIPVPKSKPGAFRPISLTNALARVADRLVTRRLTYFLEHFSYIPGEQSGFRRAMSSEMQCCSFVEWISQKQQAGQSVNCVFLDASAAYDNVNHDILMARLGALDPPARLTRWVNSFIRGRSVDTKWGSTISGKRTMHRGVPQGASMSPVLWLLYTAPIFDHLKMPSLSHHHADFMPFLYADDIAVAVSSSTVSSMQIVMQELLDHIADFCRQSCICLNPTKSVQVVFSTSHRVRTYQHRRQRVFWES